jgi:hypothetical protein
MSKEEAIAAIKLLSALESWILSQSAPLPCYLHEDLHQTMEVFERVVLGNFPDVIADDSEWNQYHGAMKRMDNDN